MASSIIASNPAILNGEPVFRGTRVPFKSLTDYLEHGRTLSEFLEDFPSVTTAEAIAVIEEARTSLTATLKRNCYSMSVSPGRSNSYLPTAVTNVRPFETQDSAARRMGSCCPWLKGTLTSSSQWGERERLTFDAGG